MGAKAAKAPARRATQIAAAFLAALLALVVAPASGSSPVTRKLDRWHGLSADAPFYAWMEPAAAANAEAVTASMQEVRERLTTGGWRDRLVILIDAGGFDVPSPAIPAPTPRDFRAVSDARTELRTPLAGLLAAVRKADRISDPIPWTAAHDLLRDALKVFPPIMTTVNAKGHEVEHRVPIGGLPRDRTDRALQLIGLLEQGVSYAGEQEIENQEPHSDPAVAELVARARALGVADRRASLLVGAALDRYLPAIEAATRDSDPEEVEGCDEVDQQPLLCVGSEAKNSYRDDVSLRIDMGGEDLYESPISHDLSGKPVVPPPDPNSTVVVNIDLGDASDAYRPDGGSGAAFIVAGGVALLIDEGGDDIYDSSFTKRKSPSPGETPWTIGGGQGSAQLGGVATLFDEGGSDSYLVSASPGTDDTVTFTAQGATYLGGVGGLIDQGTGDDVYEIDAGRGTEVLGNDHSPSRSADGQGSSGFGGAAVMFDGGGKDAFTLTSDIRYRDPNALDIPNEFFPVAMQRMGGQGSAAVGATGYLLTGEGDTTYEISTKDVGWRVWEDVHAQAYTMSLFTAQTVGGIDDLGGDDSYAVDVRSDYRPTIVVEDDCRCNTAEAIVNGLGAIPSGPSVTAQSVSGFSSTGVIRDHAGNDSYRSTVERNLDITLIDRLSNTMLPPLLRVLGVPYTSMVVQGWGMAPSPLFSQPMAGSGTVADEGGTDEYIAGTDLDLNAKVRAPKSHRRPDIRALFGYGAAGVQDPYFGKNGDILYAQGAAASGYLLDLGGTGDDFHAYQDIDVKTSPAGGDYYQASSWPSVQGGSLTGGAFVALGEDPTIVGSPSMPVYSESPGQHGIGAWLGCCTDGTDPDHQRVDWGSGYGFAPTAVGATPELEILSSTPTEGIADPRGYGRLPVAARLTDPEGKPLPGRTIHFDIQWAQLAASAQTTPWTNVYQTNVVTNRKGEARGRLPLWILYQAGDDLIPNGNFFFRVLATYDGEKDFAPRHAAQGLSLEVPEVGRVTNWYQRALRASK